jgi:hypothetical protein
MLSPQQVQHDPSNVKALAIMLSLALQFGFGKQSSAEDLPVKVTPPASAQQITSERTIPKGPLIDEVIVEELCQKYQHCDANKIGTGQAHLDELYGCLQRLLAKSQYDFSKDGTPAKEEEISSLRADIAKLSAQSPSRGLGISPAGRRRRAADSLLVLGICENYHHCSSNVVDSLHCFQLESHLHRLKSEKLKVLQTPETSKEVKDLDSDLAELKKFGTRPEGYKAPARSKTSASSDVSDRNSDNSGITFARFRNSNYLRDCLHKIEEQVAQKYFAKGSNPNLDIVLRLKFDDKGCVSRIETAPVHGFTLNDVAVKPAVDAVKSAGPFNIDKELVKYLSKKDVVVELTFSKESIHAIDGFKFHKEPCFAD